eukprot:403370581
MMSGLCSMGIDQQKQLFQNNLSSLRTTNNNNNSTFLLISEVEIEMNYQNNKSIKKQTIIGLDMRGCISEYDAAVGNWRQDFFVDVEFALLSTPLPQMSLEIDAPQLTVDFTITLTKQKMMFQDQIRQIYCTADQQEENINAEKRSVQLELPICKKQQLPPIQNQELIIHFGSNEQEFKSWLRELSSYVIIADPLFTYYSLQNQIGTGKFSEVYRALVVNDSLLHENVQEVAVKAVFKESFDEDLLRREIHALRSLREQQYVVKIYQVFDTPTHTLIVMEYFEEGDLHQKILQSNFIDDVEARSLMQSLLMGLQQMNLKGYLHKDIKTRNLLVFQDIGSLRIKIADLGLVEEINSENQINIISGTPGFIAPEILKDEKYSEKYANDLLTQLDKEYLLALLEPDPVNRLSVEQALSHQWFNYEQPEYQYSSSINSTKPTLNLQKVLSMKGQLQNKQSMISVPQSNVFRYHVTLPSLNQNQDCSASYKQTVNLSNNVTFSKRPPQKTGTQILPQRRVALKQSGDCLSEEVDEFYNIRSFRNLEVHRRPQNTPIRSLQRQFFDL